MCGHGVEQVLCGGAPNNSRNKTPHSGLEQSVGVEVFHSRAWRSYQEQYAAEEQLNLERNEPTHAPPTPEMGEVEWASWSWPERGARCWLLAPDASRRRLRLKRVLPLLPEKDGRRSSWRADVQARA
jgi:hypothetical protein